MMAFNLLDLDSRVVSNPLLKVLCCVIVLSIVDCQGFESNEKPGQCPTYTDSDITSMHCQMTSECESDYACEGDKKCCENPCGISRCLEAQFPYFKLFRKEKCPVIGAPERDVKTEASSGLLCSPMRSTFCFKDNCKRCCYHVSNCNPAPVLLTTQHNCQKRVCAEIICEQRGTECVVQEETNQPVCACVLRCPLNETYVCGTDGMTYKSPCELEREACHLGINLTILHDGICKPSLEEKDKPVERPKAVPARITVSPGNSAVFICETSHRGAHLQWYKRRDQGEDLPVSESLVYFRKAVVDDGVKRYAFLEFHDLRRGNAGRYVCKQLFRNIVAESIVKLSLRYKESNQELCLLPFDKGPCFAPMENFYFDSVTSSCQRFQFGGCQGNDNNFESVQECETHCMESINPDSSSEVQPMAEAEQCDGLLCKFYSKCVLGVSGQRRTCACPVACKLEYDPVCGNDRVTYASQCALQAQSCRWQREIRIAKKGKCPYRPPNAQQLRVDDVCARTDCPPYAKCILNPLNDIPSCVCPAYCDFNANVICGSDNSTYLNECIMRARSCRSRMFIRAAKMGYC